MASTETYCKTAEVLKTTDQFALEHVLYRTCSLYKLFFKEYVLYRTCDGGDGALAIVFCCMSV